jgi:ATP-dependent Clp protease ATP-binding subunit ClpB
MQNDKFTAIVRNAIDAAQLIAVAANHQKLTSDHILAALLRDDNITVKMLIAKAGGNNAVLIKLIDAELAKLPEVTGGGAGQLQMDVNLGRILVLAESEAKSRQDQYVAVDVLLLAMTKSSGSVAKVLSNAGVDASL